MKRSDLTIAQVQAKKKKELEQRRKPKKVKKQQKLVDRKIIIDKWIEQHKDTILAHIYPDPTTVKPSGRSQYTLKHAEIYWDGYQGLTWNQQKARLAKTLTSMMGEFSEKHLRNALKSFKTSKMWRSPDLIYAENMWNTIKTTFPDVYSEIGHELSPANSEYDGNGGVTYFYANTWVKITPKDKFDSYSTPGYYIERQGDNNKYEYDKGTRSFAIVAPQQAE